MQRWSEISIDTRAYVPHQHLTGLVPFTAGLAASTVVFDVPYYDLAATDSDRGMVSWGAHDPGVRPTSRPPELAEEIARRFGPYQADEFVYGHVWPSAERTHEMGRRLVAAVEQRARIARWLLSERLPGWDLALVVIGEYHSAVESLWHGWEEAHPLHGQASAPAARAGLIAVYEAGDRMLGELLAAFPAARVLAFAAHGMGRNKGDVPGMLLVPELLYRHFTGRTGFTADPAWQLDGTGSPDLASEVHWNSAVNQRLTIEAARCPWWRRALVPQPSRLDWMPAALYRPAWPGMRAYAMPAYYDGRLRVNLKGREARGIVPVRQYGRVLDELTALVEACTDARTSRPLALEIDRREDGDPRDRADTDADLLVRFQADTYAFQHPRLGRIGPAPCRRTGGHTGGQGAGWYLDGSACGRDLGLFRTLEVAPAVQALVDARRPVGPLAAALLAEDVGP